jgi:hypothetical protein
LLRGCNENKRVVRYNIYLGNWTRRRLNVLLELLIYKQVLLNINGGSVPYEVPVANQGNEGSCI